VGGAVKGKRMKEGGRWDGREDDESHGGRDSSGDKQQTTTATNME
jgi:hypothetical protein